MRIKMKTITQEELNKKLELHALWLEGKGGKRLDLSNMNLSGLDLRNSNLANSNLRHANLTNSILFNANLTGAVLEDTNLSNSMLCNANLTNSILFNANLTGADLEDANLRYANLRYANLCNCILKNTNLTNTELQCINHQDIKGHKVISIQFDTSRENNQLSYWKDLGVWTTGCFQGALEELLESIDKTHKDNDKLKTLYEININHILKVAEVSE